MSDAFAYLSVLLSIILGLAIAEILQGYGTLLLSRAKVRLYAPPLIWSAMMLILATHFWWASFGLAGRKTWSFGAFSAVLLQTVMLFMGSALILPKSRSAETIDLRGHYYQELRPFFTFGLLFIAIGFVKLWLLEDPLGPLTLFFFGFFSIMTLVGLTFRQPRVHEVIAPLMAVAIVIFIGIMFARLKPLQ
jgi:hypothetical protein